MCILLILLFGTNLTIHLEPYEIYSPWTCFDVGDKGEILVGDPDQGKLFLFRHDGSLKQTTGVKGEGPNEYRDIGSVVWHREGKYFWVHDPRNSRLNRYASPLEYKESIRLKTFINRPIQMNHDFLFVIRDNNGDLGSTPFILKVPIRDEAGQVELEKQPPLTQQYGVHAEAGGYAFFKNYPWDPKLLLAMGSDTYAVCFSGGSSIELVNIENGRRKKIVADFPRIPVNEQVVQETLEREESKGALPLIKKHIRVPDAQSNISRMLFDRNDNLWVFGPKRDASDEHPYLIFNRDGSLMGKGKTHWIPSVIVDHSGYCIRPTRSEELCLERFSLSR